MDTESLSNLIDSYSFSNHNVDESKWIASMQRFFENHDHNQAEIEKHPTSIFNVPKVLLATSPESYIPQQVALGPFHHWRPEVYEMQTYKLARAQKTQALMNVRLDRIIEKMKENNYENRIRGCYHKFLNITGNALMWMMIVDVAFLLDFLQSHYMEESGNQKWLEVSRKKLSHIVILRDLVMVENQIPLFLVKALLDHQSSTNNRLDKDAEKTTLKSMLTGVYKELSPFKLAKLPNVEIEDRDHLLDYMYHMTVADLKIHENNNNNNNNNETVTSGVEYNSNTNGNGGYKHPPFSGSSDLENVINVGTGKLSKARPKHLRFIGTLAVAAKKLVNSIHGSRSEDNKSQELNNKAPLVDEITIPSVTKMIQAGFTISPAEDGRISKIDFCERTCTLYLPKIELDVNTEVYLRNLVAYEACVASGPLVLARYTELMNGIIDTQEDAKYLCEQGIVLNGLKNYKEVADLWNGMNKSVKFTNVDIIDAVIHKVNNRYRKNLRVKLKSFLKKNVYKAWRFLTLLAALLMLILTVLQSFCTVYTCNRVLYQVSDTMPSPGN